MSNKRKWTNEEVQQWYQINGGLLYSNSNDLNVVVRKSWGKGYTLNWANPKAYLLQGSIIAIAFFVVYFLL